MRKLGVGFVGSDVHIGGYVESFLVNEKAVLIGACDNSQESAENISDQGSMEYFTTDYQRFLEDESIDIIVVCSPDHLHAEHAIAALRAGKHVLCEKPMTISVQSCHDIVQAVDETGLTFMVSQFMRFESVYRSIKTIYDQGRIGSAFFVEGSYIHDMRPYYTPRTWRSDPENPQNILIGGGCHPLDLLRWAVGSDIEEVHAYSNGYAATDFPLDDCYIYSCRFQNGCIGKVFVTSGCKGHGMGEGFLSIYGTEGTIWQNKLYTAQGGVEEIQFEKQDSIQLVSAHFIECILGGQGPMIDVREGAKTVAALVAGVESAESGKPVKVFNEF